MKVHLFPAAKPMVQGRVRLVKEEGVEISEGNTTRLDELKGWVVGSAVKRKDLRQR